MTRLTSTSVSSAQQVLAALPTPERRRSAVHVLVVFAVGLTVFWLTRSGWTTSTVLLLTTGHLWPLAIEHLQNQVRLAGNDLVFSGHGGLVTRRFALDHIVDVTIEDVPQRHGPTRFGVMVALQDGTKRRVLRRFSRATDGRDLVGRVNRELRPQRERNPA